VTCARRLEDRPVTYDHRFKIERVSEINDTDTNQMTQQLIIAWRTAAVELGVRVVAPYSFNGRETHTCIAHLPDFGGPRGMVIIASSPPTPSVDNAIWHDAQTAGHYVSFVSVEEYSSFKPDLFRETLLDWGFYGPQERLPSWMNE
jgi:hypothetical protein